MTPHRNGARARSIQPDMALFDMSGNYELRFKERSGHSFRSLIQAADDEDALSLARKTQYPGLALEVWHRSRLVTRFPEAPMKENGQAH